jgi:hypothetical protein
MSCAVYEEKLILIKLPEPRTLWHEGCLWPTQRRLSAHTRSCLLHLPTDVRSHHVCIRYLTLFAKTIDFWFLSPLFSFGHPSPLPDCGAPSLVRRPYLDKFPGDSRLLIDPLPFVTTAHANNDYVKRIIKRIVPAEHSPMLAIGAVAERSRLGPLLVFVFVWSTIVYDPIACWTWNPNGWVFKAGGLDFAGGTPVHISSGTAGLAISIYLGKRKGWGTERLAYKPHNSTYVVLGTVFLWFGWFGFNGGSALSGTMRAAMACTVTNVSFSDLDGLRLR